MIMKLYEIHAQTRAAQPTAVERTILRVEEIGPWLGHAYAEVAAAVAARHLGPAGPPFARYHRLGEDRFEVEAGFPVTGPVEAEGSVQPSELPGGPAAASVHVGPYDQMEPAYQALDSWVRDHGVEPAGDAWEIYFSDPVSQPDPATWRTEVVQPYRPA